MSPAATTPTPSSTFPGPGRSCKHKLTPSEDVSPVSQKALLLPKFRLEKPFSHHDSGTWKSQLLTERDQVPRRANQSWVSLPFMCSASSLGWWVRKINRHSWRFSHLKSLSHIWYIPVYMYTTFTPLCEHQHLIFPWANFSVLLRGPCSILRQEWLSSLQGEFTVSLSPLTAFIWADHSLFFHSPGCVAPFSDLPPFEGSSGFNLCSLPYARKGTETDKTDSPIILLSFPSFHTTTTQHCWGEIFCTKILSPCNFHQPEHASKPSLSPKALLRWGNT